MPLPFISGTDRARECGKEHTLWPHWISQCEAREQGVFSPKVSVGENSIGGTQPLSMCSDMLQAQMESMSLSREHASIHKHDKSDNVTTVVVDKPPVTGN